VAELAGGGVNNQAELAVHMLVQGLVTGPEPAALVEYMLGPA